MKPTIFPLLIIKLFCYFLSEHQQSCLDRLPLVLGCCLVLSLSLSVWVSSEVQVSARAEGVLCCPKDGFDIQQYTYRCIIPQMRSLSPPLSLIYIYIYIYISTDSCSPGQLITGQLLTQTLAHQANEKVNTCSPVNF